MARCLCKSRLKPVSVRDYTRFRRGIWEYVGHVAGNFQDEVDCGICQRGAHKSLSRKGGHNRLFCFRYDRFLSVILIIGEKIVSLHSEKSYLKSMRNIV